MEIGFGDFGVGECGFGADIDNRGALGVENEAAMNGGFGAEANAFAIP